jgi:TonB family protein
MFIGSQSSYNQDVFSLGTPMSKSLGKSSVRIAVFGAAVWSSIISVDVAFAADAPPRVDASFPNPQPAYPDSARWSGEQGTVFVRVYVGQDGRVDKYDLASSGFDDLDTAAVQSVLNWRFVPATRNGQLVSEWTMVKFVFHLPKPPPIPAS